MKLQVITSDPCDEQRGSHIWETIGGNDYLYPENSSRDDKHQKKNDNTKASK